MGQTFDEITVDRISAKSGSIGVGLPPFGIHLSSGSLPPGMVSLTSNFPVPVGAAQPIAVNFLCFFPFIPGRNGIVNQLGVNIGAAGGAGSVVRIAIYSSDPTSYLPALLLGTESGPLDSTTTGLKTFNPNVVVKASVLIYQAYICGVAVCSPTCLNNVPPIFGFSAGLNGQCGVTSAFNFGPLPQQAPTPTTFLSAANQAVLFTTQYA